MARPLQPLDFSPAVPATQRAAPRACASKYPAVNGECLKTIIIEEANRTIKVSEGSRQVTIPMAKAVVRALAVSVARSASIAADLRRLLSDVERVNKALNEQCLETAIEYKADWERELERRAKLGIKGREPCPIPTTSSSTCGQVTSPSKAR